MGICNFPTTYSKSFDLNPPQHFFFFSFKTTNKLLSLGFQYYIKTKTRHEKNQTNILIIMIKVWKLHQNTNHALKKFKDRHNYRHKN